jgi:hypothetical protein
MPQPIARTTPVHVVPMTDPLPAPSVGGPNPLGAPTVISGEIPSSSEGIPPDAIGPNTTTDPTVIVPTPEQINAVEKRTAQQSKANAIDIRV